MNRSVLAGVLLLTALHAFDELVLIIGLPTIAADLGSNQWYGLTIACYVLASIVGMAWSGQAMDQLGPGTVILTAAVFLLIGLITAVLCSSIEVFILARILQGIGGGMGWTIALGLISLLSPPEEAPKAVAAMDIAWIIPSLMAPLVGGFLIDYMSWRWIFALQIPVLLIALLMVVPKVKAFRGNTDNIPRETLSYVVLRSIRLALCCGLLLYILSQPIGLLWLLLIPTLAGIISPLNKSLPSGWWQLNTPLSAALVVACLAFFLFYGTEAYQPLYLIEVHGFSSIHAGLVLTAASLTWMLGSQLTARNIFAFDYATVMLIGALLLAAGFVILWLVIYEFVNVYWSYIGWAIGGLGMGTFFNTARTTAIKNTPKQQEGFVAGALSLCVSIGLSFATGLGGAIKNNAELSGAPLSSAIQAIWWVSWLTLIITIGGLFWHRHQLKTFTHSNQ